MSFRVRIQYLLTLLIGLSFTPKSHCTNVDSLKNLVPDNLKGYDSRNANEELAKIVRCKYSVQVAGNTVEETFDFYISPDGNKCYGKKGI